jgi:arylsulfatase A-like enzyme
MKGHYALITEVDGAIKDISEELGRQGILNESLVVFPTVNGFFFCEHGLGSSGGTNSFRVPLIIRGPRMLLLISMSNSKIENDRFCASYY